MRPLARAAHGAPSPARRALSSSARSLSMAAAEPSTQSHHHEPQAAPPPATLAYTGEAKALVRGLKGRSLLRVDDYSPEEMRAVLQFSHDLKRKHKAGYFAVPESRALVGKSLAMIFQKRSTRTRVSTETGAALLGMQSLFLGAEDVQLGVNESLRDTAAVLARYNSLILARVFGHDTVAALSDHSSVPVINALSNTHHPLQSLADVMTMQEHLGADLTGRVVSWIGDGNNVLNDLMLAGAMAGCQTRVATPGGEHAPHAHVVESARAIAERMGRPRAAAVALFTEPTDAVKGADVVVTDTWVSMGQEAQKQARLLKFGPYRVTRALVEGGGAKPNWKFMHCLPRHSEEVDDDVFYSANSVVFDEAENRMYTVMAVMLSMLGHYEV